MILIYLLFHVICSMVRLSFKSCRTCCWCSMWSSTAWTLYLSFREEVMGGIHRVPEMVSLFLQYERKCYTTILLRVTSWTIVFVYHRQSNEANLPDIFSLSQFFHQIENDNMSYEPIEYPSKKIIMSKNVQWRWNLCHLQ